MKNDIQIWRREVKGVASDGPAFFMKQAGRLPVKAGVGAQ